MEIENKAIRILLAGEGRQLVSVAACLLSAGHPVTVYIEKEDQFITGLIRQLQQCGIGTAESELPANLTLCSNLISIGLHDMGIIVCRELLAWKLTHLQQMEQYLAEDAPLLVNMDSFPLSRLQTTRINPGRIIGANWAEPAHTTLFLEFITNAYTDQSLLQQVYKLAKLKWGKDPYIIKKDIPVRSRLLTALIREAFYLVENNYASINDIDRACRNDPGYYLPFAGHFRYMDLMGPYAYGAVMAELNPDLSTANDLPAFFKSIIRDGGEGMANGNGCYQYSREQVDNWQDTYEKFSLSIAEIIKKYPVLTNQ